MKKIKFLKLSVIILGLFFVINFGIVYAFDCKTVCQPPLTTFSNGSSTFDISFPPGGGTTCDTIADCPTVTILDNATIFSMKVDMELTDPASEIGTPYIWVPKTGSNQLVQIRTIDCSIVKTFSNSADNCDGSAFSSPSRITVIPGGDVWVDNRTNTKVTRLGLIDPSISMEDYECKGSYNVAGGGGTNGGGVTFDINGDIWVGNYHDTFVHKFKSDGSYAWSAPNKINASHSTYGMIGDPYGHVWIANRGTGGETLQCIKSSKSDNETSANIKTAYTYSTGSVYGIGMDGNGRVYLANYSNGDVYRFPSVTGSDCPNTDSLSPDKTLSTGGGNARGVAVDQKGNVWVANSGDNRLYVFDASDSYSKHSVLLSGSGIVGVAVDADGYGWAVGNTNGKVYKYEYDPSSFTEQCTVTVGGNPYNYSDMTGLRTIPKSISIDGGESVPLSADETFVIYSGVCVPAALSSCVNPPGSISCGSEDGLCEIPLEIFSMQAGDYTLKNLEVIYGKQIPITTGGFVPCGRADNNPATPWDDTEPCNLCYLVMLLNQGMDFLIKIASAVAILAFVITGFLFITSAGNPERKNNAKATFKWVLIGFLIIFLSWLLVDFLLSAWGYLDPLGGKWNVVCD